MIDRIDVLCFYPDAEVRVNSAHRNTTLFAEDLRRGGQCRCLSGLFAADLW